MKKIFLFLFLITCVTVSAKTLVLSNSLSPPTESLDAIVKAQQLNVCFFERNVSFYVCFETYQLVIPDTNVWCAVNFQVLINPNYVRTSFEKSDIILAAISPNCRAVMLNDFFLNLTKCNTVDLTQATSPNCRDVLLLS